VAHERAIRTAWAARAKARGLKAANANLCASIDVANAEIAAKAGMIERLTGRVARLKAVLAGRKAQIAALGRSLLVARNREADIRTAGESVPVLDAAPETPAPIDLPRSPVHLPPSLRQPRAVDFNRNMRIARRLARANG
jgi:hypothetical protein